MASILVIDDLEEDNPASYISQCRSLLSHHQYFPARSWSEAQKALNREKIDVILLDKKLKETPEEELVGIEELDELSSIFSREEALAKLRENQGIYILKEIKGIRPDIPVIMITAYEDESSAFEAMMELGAYDYLGQLDVEELENKIENALQENLTQEELDEWKHQGIIFSAESKQMWEVMKTVKQAARTHSTVLILGESGTGKELIAEAIHKWSPRKNEQWIAVNCSALSESLLESELFGHVKGAYTDATSDKKGILEEANGGTIFLDEIGDMSPKLQLALLRVLEKGEIKPVGEAKIRKVNVRIITATNRDLMKEVQEGKFRYDLYVRLNQYRIDLPPLRERRADIEPLIKYFVEQNTPGNVDDLAIAPVVIKMLMDERYYWKGNVRELENIISRAVETAVAQRSKTITPAHISPYLLKALKEQEFWESEIPEAAPLQQFLTGVDTSKLSLKNLDEFLQPLREGLERRIIREALERTNWHKTDTAKLLDITRPSLNKKLEQYGDRETCPNCRQCSDRKTYHCGLYDSKV